MLHVFWTIFVLLFLSVFRPPQSHHRMWCSDMPWSWPMPNNVGFTWPYRNSKSIDSYGAPSIKCDLMTSFKWLQTGDATLNLIRHCSRSSGLQCRSLKLLMEIFVIHFGYKNFIFIEPFNVIIISYRIFFFITIHCSIFEIKIRLFAVYISFVAYCVEILFIFFFLYFFIRKIFRF